MIKFNTIPLSRVMASEVMFRKLSSNIPVITGENFL